jgi:threonine/homoserine/homoserine lactone efflux protein
VNPIYLVGLVAAISAIGSLQAGAVNVSVLQRALRGRIREARWLALGGSLPDAAYAAVAVGLGGWIGVAEAAGPVLRWGFPGVLIGLGLYYWLKPKWRLEVVPKPERRRGAFVTGILLAGANPQLLPFWLAVSEYLRAQDWMGNELIDSIAFSVGAWLGALGLLLTVAWSGRKLPISLTTPAHLKRLDYVVALILIVLGGVGLAAALHIVS